MQIIIFPIIFLIFIYKYKNSLSGAKLTSIAVTILALDMSTAAPRILSHTDYLRAGQVSKPTSVDRVFSFTGNERLPNDATLSTGSSLYNAFKKYPDQLKLVGAQPQMEVYDDGAGSQSPFAQFVRFPNNWSAPASGGLGHAKLDTVADIPGQSWPPSDGGIVIAPDCIGKQPATPTGLVTKLLPDQVLLNVQTDCTRLVVLMDTWALGWTVTVDGKPAQPIRVNGVLRGVEVTTGDHVINWFYRPVNWRFIVGVTIGSLLATIALAVASVVRHSQLKALPA